MQNVIDEQSAQQILGYLNQCTEIFNEGIKSLFTENPLDAEQSNQNTPFLSLFQPEKMSELLTKGAQIDPAKLVENHIHYMQKQAELWQEATKAMLGQHADTVIEEPQNDARFKDKDWQENPVFNYLKQAYLLNSEMLNNVINAMEFSDPKAEEQVKFYTRQYINSVAPTNHILTNPEICRDILESKGENLLKGIKNFVKDLEQSPLDAFKITQTDPSAFTLGENLATTPGKVVYQNKLIQLIHYQPTTETVHENPILITPPFINKYYILDLDQKKSLVRWLVSQGYSVFVISWVNPDAEYADVDFSQYMELGPIAATTVVKKITKARKINMVGWCVGGTLLAITVAYLKAKRNHCVNSMTLLTTLLDFSQPGEIQHFLSDDLLPSLEQKVEQKGYLDGRMLGMGFSLLRENNLFWSFFINNYLKGKDPAAFDILHWNSDATNLPAAFFKEYIGNTYKSNNLKDGKLIINDVTIDLSTIKAPSYLLSTIADHIVLWQGAYQGTKLLSGDVRFVLAGSGHLAGVINPPDKGKYPHWINNSLPETAEEWFENAEKHEGSWWPDWQAWLAEKSGKMVPAVTPGEHKDYPAIEDAPGSYVKVTL
ncbi:class I poly(R)-hydroxyalkanoic acid synthase [Paraneptunicella aestuarii]|uniref:PHA/PHB synthase family protein n=1 Tax=Paraneptunicella aestuarii TaxID=2831148 RepID=UPI001E466737|nr:class I poly(R)-hydroxyalkanoic acid synthase [Paraneptunicella aestuarii]UAA37326.1 class I poly(R)-hydroxyalkanoic acid synthase [Paraneptunicella aestuarii]